MENELFTVTAPPTRTKLFLKKKNEITVYADCIEFILDGEEETVEKEDIINIYIQEPITPDVTVRTTVIEHYADYEDEDEREEESFTIEDDRFPNFSYKMEEALEKEWHFVKERKRMMDTERWINTANAVFLVTDECDLETWGGMPITPEAVEAKAEMLESSWHIKNERDADKMVKSLLNFRTGVKGLEGWDLQRAIHVSCSAYICGYYTKEKAFDYALEAAKKLQEVFSGWDAYMKSYLDGYCYWSGEDINNSASEAYNRLQIYLGLQKLKNNPFRIDWNMPLQ